MVKAVIGKDARRWLRLAAFLLLVAAAVWANRSFDLSWSGVVSETRAFVEPFGAWGPLAFIGVCIFAALIAIIGVANGALVKGGAEGVGKVTTRAVVQSIIAIVVTDMLFAFVVTR